ncbi:MAG TPA: DUF3011 domain-containing protein [Bdellovibrionales bacterium]|jgi:hypothetical protein|nr:DUF3011 domain-containing protein [Bdellovibrionales bacterium]
MSRAVVVMLSLLIPVLSFAQSELEPGELQTTCSSTGSYTECDVGVRIFNPRVFRQLSQEQPDGYGACVFGSQWGTVGTKFWTNYGCSAVFAFTAAPSPQPSPTPPPSYRLSCEWNGGGWQPYTGLYGRFIGMARYGFRYFDTCLETIDRSHSGYVCNWDGYGFRAYVIRTNQVVGYRYNSIAQCYSDLR